MDTVQQLLALDKTLELIAHWRNSAKRPDHALFVEMQWKFFDASREALRRTATNAELSRYEVERYEGDADVYMKRIIKLEAEAEVYKKRITKLDCLLSKRASQDDPRAGGVWKAVSSGCARRVDQNEEDSRWNVWVFQKTILTP